MGTKSKRFSYKPFKAVAFILCLVLAGTSSFYALRIAEFAWRAGYYYGFDNFGKSIYDVRLSKDFLDEVGFVYYAAKRAYITYDNGEAFTEENFQNQIEESRSESIKKLAEERSAGCRQSAEEYNSAVRRGNITGTNSYVDENGKVHSENIYDGEYQLSSFSGNKEYIVSDDGTVKVNEKYFYDLAVNDFGSSYTDALASAKTECAQLKRYLSTLKAAEYMIVDSGTGEVFTNSGLKTVDEFTKKYADTAWFVGSNDNFDSATVGTEFAELSSMTDTPTGIAYYDKTALATSTSGAALGSSAYVGQFFSSMRYGYTEKISEGVDYVLGSTGIASVFDSKPCSIYISYDFSKADSADPFYSLQINYLDLVSHLSQYAAICLVSLFLIAVITVWLIIVSGRDYRDAPVRALWEDKIFTDLRTLFSGAIVFGGAALAVFLTYLGLRYEKYSELCMVGCIAAVIGVFAVLLDYLFFFARSCKNGTLLKNLLLFLPIKLAIKFGKRLRGNNSRLPDGVKKQFKIVVPCYLAATLLCMLLMSGDGLGAVLGLIGLVSINICFFMLLYSYAKSLDKIRDTVDVAHNGNYGVEFNCESMPKPMEKLAEQIADMRAGMQTAVNTAVQDQRTKTELITNVSHDLKTPLTSIITYTDLIKRSGIEDESVRGYVEVLSEKSLRLKQLIDDLTEATKASTGNVEFQIVDVNLYELALQAIGENEDCLDSSGIEMRMTPNEVRPIVRADGQKTYRVLENIISNISKYAMQGTRAYVTLEATPQFGMITFKNISKAPLDIPPEQLMERFVRGDSSRGGEGSGLGLSIAKDLCALQGGKFEIGIDGDMFKATVSLPLSPSQCAAPPAPENPIPEEPTAQ